MTITITDYTMACGSGSHCRHPLCADCGRPLRPASVPVRDHPGTVNQYVTSNCRKCWLQGTRLTEADLQDQRHVLMSDDEMLTIWYRDPAHWEWLMQRRYRLDLVQEATA